MLRFGLSGLFRTEEIVFMKIGSESLKKLKKGSNYLSLISKTVKKNCKALKKAILFCSQNTIGSFQVTNSFFPLYTHPNYGYTIDDLPDDDEIFDLLDQCRALSQKKNIRLIIKPDKDVVLNSSNLSVVKHSVKQLDYHAIVADLIGADTIIITLDDDAESKRYALRRFLSHLDYISSSAREKIAVKNDDRIYTPKTLIPFCHANSIPFVYDLHHHRCLADGIALEMVTKQAIPTWKGREPIFRIASPRCGWNGEKPSKYHDYVDVRDFPLLWKTLPCDATIEVEAKAREDAVIKLIKEIDML